ncbi:Gluconate dehydratase [Candidatus Rhodobacter oscarellae]|uniref:Gluconate dehydratase n=1 Tax=Candidatus Rhodobacter oscarellae TaxID=1675527 RepID=A0A0J9E3Q2_9RHOB|nr:galactonate dehydratase [Candidatus Rhodobacter lobularis]KMW57431.1 Gluconate dehydratase [Candidatus Rhodobacter lobularis]
MKITDIKVHLLKEWRTLLIVVVETDQGTYGLGESGLTSREYAVEGMIRDLKSLLIGQDPFRIEHLWQVMWRSGFHPSGQVLSSAISAIDMALYDIKGKALGVPVYELLGGRTRDKVLSYCHIHGDTPEETLAAARKAVAEGWKVLRWEPSYEPDMVMRGRWAVDKAIEEFRLLRQELGPDIELAFDAHTKLTPPEAAYFCEQIKAYRPMFVEDPLRSEFADGYSLLRQQTGVPLAAGEQFATKWQFRQLIQRNLIDYARVDVCIAGGLTEAKKIAALCETQMIDLTVHNPIGPISTAACLHLNLSCPNVLVQELPRRPGECVPDLITTDQVWRDGWLECGAAPGLGVELNPAGLVNYPFIPEHLPILRREDGSFANW